MSEKTETKKPTAKVTIKAEGKTYTANINIPDYDGTTTLPMIAFDTIKRIAGEFPELHLVRKLTVEAQLC